MQYFFILGHNPTLSIAEITNILRVQANKFQVTDLSDEVLILETENKIDARELQKELGGTIKIGKIISDRVKFDKGLLDLIIKQLPKNKKIYFGFSVYKLAPEAKAKKQEREIKRLAMEVKRTLKDKKISSRWVSSKERTLSSVIVQKNKLLIQGAEICFFIGRGKMCLGKSLSCQEFEKYEFYDFARPERPIEKGMLPPKLAKIMINFSGPADDKTILDPFCGSGTILQEAARLGHTNIIGADIEKKAIDDTKKNLKWFAENFQFPRLVSDESERAISNFQIFQCDVKELSKKIPENSVDAIVTEPYLGPVKIINYQSRPKGARLAQQSRAARIKDIISELSDLYLATFKEFKKVLKPNGRVVIILPIFSQKIEHPLKAVDLTDEGGLQRIYLSELILPILKKENWQTINPLPPNLKKHPVIQLTKRNSIIYSRPNQKILREIFIFEKGNA